ncbi:MAG: acyl-CoA thioesterase [Muribaculaceae bacterium]|nr:acyl-CoA thioesterase [Muribaculaceae bacterium]
MQTTEQPAYSFRLHTNVQIRFTDIDMLGHLNNSVYTQFMDLGKVDYFTTINGGPIEWDSINLVIANINVNFLKQTTLYEPIEVVTRCEHIGTKSLVLHQQIVNKKTGEVKADGRATMVSIDLKTKTTTPITDDWRRKISEFEGREF